MTEQAAWVALSLVRGVGGVTMQALLAKFGSATAVLSASERDLRRVRGVGKKTAAAIQVLDINETQQQLSHWQAADVTVLTSDADGYPRRLQSVDDLPPTLFMLGELPRPDAPHIAIVGTRSPSPAAREQAAQAGERLAQAGAVVVSGMALGIDGIAMQAAMGVPKSRLIGVLGSGVLKPYPARHAGLAHMLGQVGALMCEVAPDATVSTPGLVARNRIISGLADAVVVVETSPDGGAMHAARAAYKQNRPLWTIDSGAAGNQKLLASGYAQPLAPDLHN